MPLDEAEFTKLVDAGCTCGSHELHVEALVAQKLELYRGDLYGSPSWGYKGEQLVQGTYSIACARCHHELYATAACPLCGEVMSLHTFDRSGPKPLMHCP